MRAQLKVPRHHVAVNYKDDEGRSMRLLVTDGGVVEEFLAYRLTPACAGMSRSWWNKAAQSVGLLIDHAAAVEIASGSPVAWGPHYLEDLKLALRHGTLTKSEIGHSCSLDLGWGARKASAVTSILRHIVRFADFCSERYRWPELNPRTDADSTRRAKGAGVEPDGKPWSWATKRANSSLGHRVVAITSPHRRTHRGDPPAFPPEKFDLLLCSFRRRGISARQPLTSRVHIRDAMIAMLQGAGGLRVSEAFHIYVEDVEEDPGLPGVARVRVHHPSDSAVWLPDPATGDWTTQLRADYLREKGSIPRNQAHGALEAGWKDPKLTLDGSFQYFEVRWFPVRYGEAFLSLYRQYMAIRPHESDSPFLFLNDAGRPYTIRQYEKKLRAACIRAGVAPLKQDGGTSHGLRHHYAQGLKGTGLSTSEIAACLNQNEETSAEAYTGPSSSQIAQRLRDVDPPGAGIEIPLLANLPGTLRASRGGDV